MLPVLLALVEEAVLAHGLIHDVAAHEWLRLIRTRLRVLPIGQLLLRIADVNVI